MTKNGKALDLAEKIADSFATPKQDYRDVSVPKNADALADIISKGVARVLELATEPKDLTDAVKAATAWYQARYPHSGGEEYGKALKRTDQ